MAIVERPFLAASEPAPTFDVTGWVLRLAACGVFMAVGLTKFESHSMWVPMFAKIGFGDWFRYLAGTLQIAGGLLFLIPRAAYVAAALVGCTMVGAIAAHLFVLGSGVGGAIFPFALLIFVLAIAMRRSE